MAMLTLEEVKGDVTRVFKLGENEVLLLIVINLHIALHSS